MAEKLSSESTQSTTKRALWQSLQRKWPFTKLCPPTRLADPIGSPLCNLPLMPFDKDWDAHVILNAIKGGNYKGQPATLVRLTIQFPLFQKMEQACIELQMKNARHSSTKSKSSMGRNPVLAAYGPALVVKPPDRDPSELDLADLAWVAMYRKGPDKLMVFIHGARSAPHYVPLDLRVAFVLLHGPCAVAEIRAVPSSPSLQRAIGLRRARVTPLEIDLWAANTDENVTCAANDGQPCSSDCAEFGPQHMTPTAWYGLLDDSPIGDWIAADPQRGWVSYVE